MKSAAVAQEFQRLLDPGTVAGLTEPQLLERFVETGDPVAFEAIVTRFGPMVYTVCRQLLRDPNDADDAFQATFLLYIKKAASLRRPERLGPWLYGVAYRVAQRVRSRRRTSDLPDDLAGPRLASPNDPRKGEASGNHRRHGPHWSRNRDDGGLGFSRCGVQACRETSFARAG